MAFLTVASFLLFTAAVAGLTYRLTRDDDHSTAAGYFLAGRSLTFPLIAGSLLLTNLSTEQLVGLNGGAFKDGLCVMVWEVVCVVALVLMAWFFLPRFLKSGVATVPDYLGLRFDETTRLIANVVFLVAYVALLLPVILYTGAAGMNSILDVPGKLSGVAEAVGMAPSTLALWAVVWAVGLIGSVYAIFGGLRTVAVSDTINGVFLFTGGLLVSFLALRHFGDGSVGDGLARLKAEQPARLNSLGTSETSVPFYTIFSGIFLINLFYWTTNQQIIQRTLAASSLAEGQKGVLLTGALKLLGPLYLVLPGLVAFSLFGDLIDGEPVDGVQYTNADAYGLLVREVLPAWLTGFFAAALLGAVLSSFNSALNATCTLFSYGVYKRLVAPDATDEQLVRVGRRVGWAFAVLAMLGAPLLAQSEQIFEYLQTMNAIYFIPIFAVVLVGMLTRRVPARAANIALPLGIAVITAGYFVPGLSDVVAEMTGFQFVGTVFMWLVVLMLILGEVAPRETEFVQEDVGAVDMTPWRGAKPAGLALIAAVLAIYAAFADFSVFG